MVGPWITHSIASIGSSRRISSQGSSSQYEAAAMAIQIGALPAEIGQRRRRQRRQKRE